LRPGSRAENARSRRGSCSWLRGYVQLGGGIGLDIKLAKHTHFGSSFRTLLMGFRLRPARLEMKDQWA